MINTERRTAGIIFSNMHDSAISNLTQIRTMASVPFGGRYRLIDFPLSSMVNAGIVDIGVITKANYQSLMDHVGSGREWDLSRKRGGLHIIPPYGDKHYGMYRGKLEALGAALSYLRKVPAKYVVLSDCELVANIDFAELIEAHKKTKADMTLLYHRSYLSNEQAQGSTLFSFDESGRLTEVMVHPDMSGEFNCSMNVVIVDRELLIKLVSTSLSKGEYSLDADFLQKHCGDYKIMGKQYQGLVRVIRSMKEYYQANIDLLGENVQRELFLTDRPIYTKVRDEAPVRYGLNAQVSNSFVADGCIIDGHVENSILFRGCKIAKGASVKNSILMQDTIVGEKCDLQYAITDKQVQVSNYRTIIATASYPAYIAKNTTV